MNWYKQSQLDFGGEMTGINNAVGDFNSSPYIQQQGNQDASLDMDQLNKQLDINNSKNDPEIQAMEQRLREAEDQDGDGVNDIEQLIEELQVEAYNFKKIKVAQQNNPWHTRENDTKRLFAQQNNPWLDARAWQSMGAYAQEKYNTAISAFKANVKQYKTLKGELAETKQQYDNGLVSDKGGFS